MPPLRRDGVCITRPPRVVAAITSTNRSRSSRAHFIAAPPSVPEHAGIDLLMQEAVELVAVAHVSDRHEVGTDHAGQLESLTRLADDAGTDQSIMS